MAERHAALHVAFLSFLDGMKENQQAGYSQSQKLMESMIKLSSSHPDAAVRVSRIPWDDESFDWTTVNFAIPIEVWSYYEKTEQFVAWLEAMSASSGRCRLANGVNVVKFNLCKLYLYSLSQKGVSIVPTVFVGNPQSKPNPRPEYTISPATTAWSKENESLKAFLSTFKSGMIVKPTISAGAFQTIRVAQDEVSVEKALEKSKEVLQGVPHYVDAMVQPFLPEIEEDGERSMVFIQGKLMHAIQKVPKNGDFRVQKKFGGQYQTFDPSTEELAFGYATIKAASELIETAYPHGGTSNLIVYARCDYVIADDGSGVKKPLLMELELIEPELFIPYSAKGDAGFDDVAQAFLSLALNK